MKIAATYDNELIFAHFGHTENFKVYEIDGKEIKSSEVVNTNGTGHEALAVFLKNLGVSTLVCGGIGAGAVNALKQAGIIVYGGVSGNCDQAVRALLSGMLKYNPNPNCNHHHDGEHGEHNCSHHEE